MRMEESAVEIEPAPPNVRPRPSRGGAGSNVSRPSCGAPMQLKLARRGRNAGGYFWSCTRFPACRETREYERRERRASGEANEMAVGPSPRESLAVSSGLTARSTGLAGRVDTRQSAGRCARSRSLSRSRHGVAVLDRSHGRVRGRRPRCRAGCWPAEEDHPTRNAHRRSIQYPSEPCSNRLDWRTTSNRRPCPATSACGSDDVFRRPSSRTRCDGRRQTSRSMRSHTTRMRRRRLPAHGRAGSARLLGGSYRRPLSTH